jgi:rhamnogalacturonan endolyase
VNGEALSGLDLSGTTHTKAGTYQDTWVFTDVTGNYANATGAVTDVIAKAGAKLTLAALTQGYDGTPRPATVVTEPAELGVTVNYDGNSAAPIYPGSYLVTATIDDPNYSGSASDTLRVHATARVRGELAIAGELDGSVQLVAAVDRDLEGSATLTGDVLLPGLPQVKVAGTPTYAGVTDASGASTPADYTFALKGRAVARYIVRRVDAGAWPVVTAPTASTGTRSVTLNRATDEIGESVTFRALTLNGNAGTVTLPGGAYDTLTVNGGSTLVLGSAAAATPVVYDVQRLILNGSATVKIAGPVILKLGHELTVNGIVGAAEHPEWLDLQVASDGVTLNSRAILHGSVTAPNGRVTINGHASLRGRVSAADLTINGNGALVDPANDGLAP